MKFEYLQPEDKRNLKILRHKKDQREIAEILDTLSYRAPTFQIVFLYVK